MNREDNDMSIDQRAMQIIDKARKSYLREVRGWDEERVQKFRQEPALWVVDAVKAALTEGKQ